MKELAKIEQLLITSNDIGTYVAVGALLIAILSFLFNRLGTLLKDKGEIVTIGTKLDRAIDDIEKNEDEIKEVKNTLAKIESKVENLQNSKK